MTGPVQECDLQLIDISKENIFRNTKNIYLISESTDLVVTYDMASFSMQFTISGHFFEKIEKYSNIQVLALPRVLGNSYFFFMLCLIECKLFHRTELEINIEFYLLYLYFKRVLWISLFVYLSFFFSGYSFEYRFLFSSLDIVIFPSFTLQ